MSGIAEPADASEPTTANLSELLTAHYSLLCVALFRLSDGAVFAVPSIPSNYISNDPLFRVDTSDLPQCVTDCMESSSTLPVPPAYAPWFHYTLSPIASVAHATALHVCPLPGIGFSLLATVNVPATMASPPPHPPLLTAQSSLSSVFDTRESSSPLSTAQSLERDILAAPTVSRALVAAIDGLRVLCGPTASVKMFLCEVDTLWAVEEEVEGEGRGVRLSPAVSPSSPIIRTSAPSCTLMHVVRSGSSVCVDSISAAPHFNPALDIDFEELSAGGPDALSSSALFLPINTGPSPSGVIRITRSAPFSPEESFCAMFLARSVGTVVHSKLSIAQLTAAHATSATILSCLTAASRGSDDVFDMAQRVLEVARPAIGATQLSLFLLDRARQQLWCAALSASSWHCGRPGPDGSMFKLGSRLPMFKGVVGALVSHGSTVRLRFSPSAGRPDPILDDKLGLSIHTLLGVAVLDAKGRVVGVLLAVNKVADGGTPVIPPSISLPTASADVNPGRGNGDAFGADPSSSSSLPAVSLMSPSEPKRARLRMYAAERKSKWAAPSRYTPSHGARPSRLLPPSSSSTLGPGGEEDDGVGDVGEGVRPFASPDVAPIIGSPSFTARPRNMETPVKGGSGAGSSDHLLDVSYGGSPVETVWTAGDGDTMKSPFHRLDAATRPFIPPTLQSQPIPVASTRSLGSSLPRSTLPSSQPSMRPPPTHTHGGAHTRTTPMRKSRASLPADPAQPAGGLETVSGPTPQLEGLPATRRRSGGGVGLSKSLQQGLAVNTGRIAGSSDPSYPGPRSMSSPPSRDTRAPTVDKSLAHADIAAHRGVSQPPSGRSSDEEPFFGPASQLPLSLPLLEHLRCAGEHPLPPAFTDGDVDVLTASAIEIGIALQRSSLDVLLHRESEYSAAMNVADMQSTPRKLNSLASFVSSFYSNSSTAPSPGNSFRPGSVPSLLAGHRGLGPKHSRSSLDTPTTPNRLPSAASRSASRPFMPVSPPPPPPGVSGSLTMSALIESPTSDKVTSPAVTLDSRWTPAAGADKDKERRRSSLSNERILAADDDEEAVEITALDDLALQPLSSICSAVDMAPTTLDAVLHWKRDEAERAAFADARRNGPAIMNWTRADLPNLHSWSFEPWLIIDEALVCAVPALLSTWGLLDAFDIDDAALLRFASAIRGRYTDSNSFHNFYHALGTFQSTHMMMSECGFQGSDPVWLLGTLLAALCHDIDHPGVSNTVLTSALSDLSVLYNDMSVLENHHTAVTWEVLRKPECDILGKLTETGQLRRFRQFVVAAILATDMSKHHDIVTDTGTLPEWPAIKDSPEPVYVRMCRLFVHLADLSAQTLPYAIAAQWGARVISEFKCQAVLESAHPEVIARSPYMHELDSDAAHARLQSGFCTFILRPLWEAASDVFPPLRPRLVQLLENSAAYSEIANPKQASPPKADQQVEVQLQVGAPDGVGAQGAGEAARAEPPLVRSE